MSDEEEFENLECQQCKKMGAFTHECPFRSEIADNHEECVCCGDCRHECEMGI